MKKTIHLDRLATHVQIGIHEFERAAPQLYEMSVWLELTPDYWCQADCLSETVDYDALRARILAHLRSRAFNLQETVAQHVLTLCFDLDARVESARVVVAKPTVYPDCKGVGLDYFATREEWRAHAPAQALLP